MKRNLTRVEHPARRVAIYTRKSTEKGLEQAFNSLDAQREACLTTIARQPDWKVTSASYDDGGFSGATTDRPAFQRLLSDIKKRRIDVVVVYKVDRLSRSLLDFAQLMEFFDRHGVAFVSVTQNFSTADAMGRLTLNLLMSFAEFEREMIAERTRDKMRALRRRGKWTGGQVPFGYRVEQSRLVVEPSEAEVVREAFAKFLECNSPSEVARYLREDRNRTKRGKPWDRYRVEKLLRYPVVAGLVHCAGELVEGEHEAIIPRDDFDRAQEMLARGDPEVHVRDSEYLLTGLTRCACCGSTMTTASTTTRGTKYRYYRCVAKVRLAASACAASPVRAETLEAFVLDKARALDHESVPQEVVPILDTFDATWPLLSNANRQRFMRALVDRVEVNTKTNNVRVTFRAPTTRTIPADTSRTTPYRPTPPPNLRMQHD